MWKIIQELIPFVLIILLISQIIVPLLFNGTTWWLFKKEKKKELKVDSTTLSGEIKATKVIVDEAKTKAEIIKEKVEENLKTAEDLKKEADNLNK